MTPSTYQLPSTPKQLLPLSLARMVWNKRLMIVCLTVVLSAAFAWIIKGLPNVYRADAVIIVDSQKIPEKFVSSTVQATLTDSMSAISQQVLNSRRMQEIIYEFNLYPQQRQSKTMDEVVALFRKELSITLERGLGQPGRPGAFRIAFEGNDAAMVTGVVNRVAGMFVQENRKTREQRAEGTSEFIEAQMREARKSLDEQESKLSQFKLRWAGELPQQEHALLSQLSRLEVELEGNRESIQRAQQSMIMLESTLRFAESSLASAMRAAEPPARPVTNPDSEVNRAATPPAAPLQSEVLKNRLATLLRRYNLDHPEVRRLKLEIEEAEKEEQQIAARTPAPKPKPNEPPALRQPADLASRNPMLLAEINRERERIATTNTQIELLKNEIKNKNAERDRIIAEISQYQQRVEKLPIREQQMASLTRDYEITKGNYRSLLDKKLSAEMATDMERQEQSERFTIADPARLPEGPIKPKRAMMYVGAAVGSLVLSMFVALLLELRRNVFLGEWELPSNVKLLGRISYIDPKEAEGGIHAALCLGALLLTQFSGWTL